jgi:penicillin-binding protein 1C
VKATIAVEDRRFYSHLGVDLAAILRAGWQDITRLKIHSGASTITEQLVRILDQRPRTFVSKAVEAFCALKLERQRSKDALLEAYLNLAPYGGNLRGAEAAALRYFGKSARDLSFSEAALLAGIPQSPARWRPDVHLSQALERRRIVLEAMLRAGYATKAQLDETLATRPEARAHPWPFFAPHLADFARSLPREPGGSEQSLRTTLDREAESLAEERLKAFFASRAIESRHLGGGVVVLEVATGAVRAMVGSPDFFDRSRRGALNACVRPRSPGSALKPFTYALAFDRGIAAPESYLADTPLRLGSFQPENFDQHFHGPLPASEALSRSLNVPAVRLQEKLGTECLLHALRGLGLRTLTRPAKSYGLSLTLGGAEVTLLDLANAYAALARWGVYRPWRVSETKGEAREERVFSPGAALLVVDILSSKEHLRRAIPGWCEGQEGKLAYKTGTSFGYRDAWAIALSSSYVVGVWIGDPAGKPQPGLVGVETAAPVALEIASGLEKGAGPLLARSPAPSEGPSIRDRPVCAVSGFPAGKWCPRAIVGKSPSGAPPLPPCSVHREALVDIASGFEVCRACAGTRPTRKQIVEAWPAEVETWFRQNGLRGRVEVLSPTLPRHNPLCGSRLDEGRPRILSPVEGVEYRLLGGVAFEQRLFLSAAASPGVSTFHWFVDGERIAAAAPEEEVPWRLHRGTHRVRCVDDRGRAAGVSILVR